MKTAISSPFFPVDRPSVIELVGKEKAVEALSSMLLIRQFEKVAENCYYAGKIGGFFHSYIGEEAIQTAAVFVMGKSQWYTTAYRCHGLALLLGETPETLMAELFGKASGVAKGRGRLIFLVKKCLEAMELLEVMCLLQQALHLRVNFSKPVTFLCVF